MNKLKYYNAGRFMGSEIWLEEGIKLDWISKVALFFKTIAPKLFARLCGEDDDQEPWEDSQSSGRSK